MQAQNNAAQAGAATPGLTVKQYRCVLQVIASRMEALHELLMLLQEANVPAHAVALVNSAEFMAETIGSMADSAVGGYALGSIDRWHYGPDFEKSEGGGCMTPYHDTRASRMNEGARRAQEVQP